MFMKRYLLLLLFISFSTLLFSQNTLIIHQKDGQQFSYGFDEKPFITYGDSSLIVSTTNTRVYYYLELVDKFTFTFDGSEAGIDDVAEVKSPSVNLDSYVIKITGAKANIPVSIIGSDGRVLNTFKTDEEGTVSFNISELSEGIYVIKSEGLTCKIQKK